MYLCYVYFIPRITFGQKNCLLLIMYPIMEAPDESFKFHSSLPLICLPDYSCSEYSSQQNCSWLHFTWPTLYMV